MVADGVADLLSAGVGSNAPVIAVDSMQVYREIPIITNQARRRPAELVGITPVNNEWTVAHHRRASDDVIERTAGDAGVPVVFDAGTGMYLNAILFDIRISPKVSHQVRQLAQELSVGTENPRRAAREKELELSGEAPRSSIWHGGLRYDAKIVYLRPDRSLLDADIAARSATIVAEGIDEADHLTKLFPRGIPNRSVADSIGVKELVAYTEGSVPLERARQSIEARTRQLARRQMRWFDKLVRSLEGRTRTLVWGERVRPHEDRRLASKLVDLVGQHTV
ncbi:MAG: hypothetical protein ACFB50_09385 [Rubrobacteraceae bacterium]